MDTEKEIVMFVRSSFCPGVALARDVMRRYNVPFREVDIDAELAMAEQIKAWTNFLSVPTIIVAKRGEDVPYTNFLPRPADRSIKGYDRGPMITEPNNKELENWLHKHGFLEKPYHR